MSFYISQAIYSLLSTFGFSILFNGPKNCLVKASLCGMAGWTVNVVAMKISNSPTLSTFLGALTVGLMGEIFAKAFKRPATMFIIPGVIPLVPGSGMYYTMLTLITGDFSETAQRGSETVFTAFSIAIAIIIASSVSKGILKFWEIKTNRKELIYKR